jgi:hypothetical protein
MRKIVGSPLRRMDLRMQNIHHAHVGAGIRQLAREARADKSGTPCDQNRRINHNKYSLFAVALS